MNIPIVNTEYIEIDLDEQIRVTQAGLDNVTQGRDLMTQVKQDIQTALAAAESAAGELIQVSGTVDGPHHAILSALTAILQLNVQNARSMQTITTANHGQYSKAVDYHGRQLQLLTEMKERMVAGQSDQESSELPLQ